MYLSIPYMNKRMSIDHFRDSWILGGASGGEPQRLCQFLKDVFLVCFLPLTWPCSCSWADSEGRVGSQGQGGGVAGLSSLIQKRHREQ